tara:strand:+ start:9399 stop:10301 length:903 start_codon:yes stop_codon:yes gene_type:complete
MEICQKLPQELKNLIYAFIPMDERIKIILGSEFKIEVINSYKWGRSTMGIYSDYSDLVNIMRIKPKLPKLKKIVYHDGYTERSSKHPVMNLIDSDFNYSKIYNKIIPLMFGFERNWNAGAGGKLIITEDDWNALPEGDYLRRRHHNYKGYCTSVKNRIVINSNTAIELIIKYLKVKSNNEIWDYKLHKMMLNKYISLVSSDMMKKNMKGYKNYRRELEEKRLIRMEKYNSAREIKMMVKEERRMKNILRIEKRRRKEQERLRKVELLKEKKEIRLMDKEDKLMKKLIIKENREKKKLKLK